MVAEGTSHFDPREKTTETLSVKHFKEKLDPQQEASTKDPISVETVKVRNGEHAGDELSKNIKTILAECDS